MLAGFAGSVRVARRRRAEAHVAVAVVVGGEAKFSNDRSGVMLGGRGVEPLVVATLVPIVEPLVVVLAADSWPRPRSAPSARARSGRRSRWRPAARTPPSTTTRCPSATGDTKRASLDSSMMSCSGTSFSSTLNLTAETGCGSRRRAPCTIAEIHAPVADAAMPAVGGSRWSMVSYSGKHDRRREREQLELLLRRQNAGAHRVDLVHRHVAADARKHWDHLSLFSFL